MFSVALTELFGGKLLPSSKKDPLGISASNVKYPSCSQFSWLEVHKLINRNFNRVGRSEWGTLTSNDNSRALTGRRKPPSSLGKDSASEKPWTLLFTTAPTSFPPLQKCSPSLAMGTCTQLTTLRTPSYTFLLVLHKLIFGWRNNWQSFSSRSTEARGSQRLTL